SAREGHLVVDDQDFAVGSVVRLPHLPPGYGSEPGHLHSGFRHLVDQTVSHLRRTDGIQEDSDLHPRPGPFGQGIRHLAGDVARPVDEGDEVDPMSCQANGSQHGRKYLHTVAQPAHGVPLEKMDTDKGLQCPAEAVRAAQPNSIPCANGRSSPQLMVVVWRRMYAFQASDPASLPPPVSFSPPKAPPISAPEVPMFTLAIPQSEPVADRNRSPFLSDWVK